MLKYLIFGYLIALALGHEVYYGGPSAYVAPGSVVLARSGAVVPLAYSRIHAPAAAAVAAVETYNSVHTPDSFQQQYRSDYNPLSYEYINTY